MTRWRACLLVGGGGDKIMINHEPIDAIVRRPTTSAADDLREENYLESLLDVHPSTWSKQLHL